MRGAERGEREAGKEERDKKKRERRGEIEGSGHFQQHDGWTSAIQREEEGEKGKKM